MSAFGPKADIAEPRPNYFQPSDLTRYDEAFAHAGLNAAEQQMIARGNTLMLLDIEALP
jgi:hypothetical protein